MGHRVSYVKVLRRECDTLSHVDVCINRTKYIDMGGSAASICPIGM